MKKILLILITSLNFATSNSQTLLFDKTYGGQFLDSPVFTYYANQKHYVFGNINYNVPSGSASLPSPDFSEQFGNSDYNMVIYDTTGIKLTDKSFGGLNNDYLIKVIPNATGFYLIGRSYSTNDGNKTNVLICPPSEIWIITVDFNGNKIAEKSICIPAAFDTYTTSAVLKALYDIIPLSDGGFMFYIGLYNTPGATFERLAWFTTDPLFNVKKRASIQGLGISSSGSAPALQRLKGLNAVDLLTGKFAFLANTPFAIGTSYYNFSFVCVVDTATSSTLYDKWFLTANSQSTPKCLIKYGTDLLLFSEDTPLNTGTTNFFTSLFASSPAIAYLRTAPARTTSNKKDIWAVKLTNTLTTISEHAIGSDEDSFVNSAVQIDQPNTLLLGCYTKGGSAFDKTTMSNGGYDYWIVMFNPLTMAVIYDFSYGGSNDDILTAIGTPPGYLLYTGTSKSGISADKTEASRDSGTQGDYWTLGFCIEPAVNFTANYTYLSSGNLVTFTNLSRFASEFYWDFGDGSFSYSKDPVHYYYTPGFYTVRLYCYNPGGCSGNNSIINYIYVNPLGIIESVGENKLEAYPNPTSDKIYVTAPDHSQLKVFDTNGRMVFETFINSENDRLIDVSSFKNGLYYLSILLNNNSSNIKFLKN